MDQPASLTANDSGRRRFPWQTLHSVADMYCVIHSRYASEPDSSKLRSRNFRMPGKRKPFSVLDFFGVNSPSDRTFDGGYPYKSMFWMRAGNFSNGVSRSKPWA